MTKLKTFLQRSVSKLAMAAKPHMYAGTKSHTQYIVSKKIGKKGSVGRRIIRQEIRPPMLTQIGAKPDGMPILKAIPQHRFLHATKGWRTYRSGTGMPFANPTRFAGLPRYPSPLGKPHRVHVKQPGITIENKKGAKRVVLGWRPFKREDVAA